MSDRLDTVRGDRLHRLRRPGPPASPTRPRTVDWEPGDIVAYRCEDCLDRWDLVLADDDDI